MFRSNEFWPSYGPWTLKFGQIFSCHHFFSLCLEILTWFLVWVYNHKLQINFEICSGWMIFGQLTAIWALKFGQIFICHHFISLWFEILTWFLVWECRVISYRATLKFIPVEWFLANLQLLGFTFRSGLMVFGRVMARGLGNLAIHLVVTTFFPLWFEILTWFLVCECIVMSYRSSLNFVPIEWFWANLCTLDF